MQLWDGGCVVVFGVGGEFACGWGDFRVGYFVSGAPVSDSTGVDVCDVGAVLICSASTACGEVHGDAVLGEDGAAASLLRCGFLCRFLGSHVAPNVERHPRIALGLPNRKSGVSLLRPVPRDHLLSDTVTP